MDKQKICEAMYALPGEVVVRRRKSLLPFFVLLAAGAAMIAANNILAGELTNNLSSALVFSGGILALTGMIAIVVRRFGSDGAPFLREGKTFLRYEEFYFERPSREEVVRTIEQGDLRRLSAMPRAQVPALAVAVYRSRDNRFAAMQAFEYAELEYKPLTALKIVTG